MRFVLNLATKRYVDQRSVTLILGSVVVLALLAALYNGFRIAGNVQALQQVEGQLAAIAGSYQKGSGVSEKEYTALLGTIAQTNDILVRKGREWLLIFQRLEETVPDGVAITSLEPDMKAKNLKIQGVAGSFGRLRRFVENLQGSPHFRAVSLESHAENREGEMGRTTVTFTLSCGGDFL
jgi:type IV pilus assembly protein PilN